ncbi:tyrosine-type recombinase/integrase [Frankia sp. Cr2]|uniref:tyrosine-type recombinase/integrase n=1 Tax=Frankia sp. Cr2 TaxID=3073932 RepID=UPI002AD44ABE|nr:tyrosine-type recombinase/integrase [Frankia sp. Cr2]
MGYSKKRTGKNSKTRYTACYLDLRGQLRSAGTYGVKKDADRAWQAAEVKQNEGRVGDPKRGRQTFEQYVTRTWFPNHLIEPSTRGVYRYCVKAHIMPWFQTMRMFEIMPGDVREWVTDQISRGLSPSAISKNMTILGAIFTTALNDQVTFLHPCRGVRTPEVPIKPLEIIAPEQFDRIYDALDNPVFRLLVELDIESGMRWGELTELRPRDVNLTAGIVTVSRAVVPVSPQDHPTGGRFLVQEYPKDKEYRRFTISAQVIDKLREYIQLRGLGPDDLLFPMPEQDTPAAPRPADPAGEDDTLGLTEPNAKGRQYRHGTITAYSMAPCRCQHCKSAYAAYRAKRRAAGKDNPRKVRRQRDTDGHIPGDWFRKQIWHPAVAAAGIGRRVRVHDLRHAHASWLLAGGADLQVVKERMGHGSIATTQRYLHTLPTADETALNALDRIRGRRTA